jgi:hypothetical protein
MKKYLLMLSIILNFNINADFFESNEWQDGIIMDTGYQTKRCTAGVFNNDGAFFTFNMLKNENENRKLFFEFRSSVDIENKGYIIADFDFYNSKQTKREDLRLRLSPESESDNRLFILDSSVNTTYAIEKLINMLSKYQYFYINTFDKNWVEFPFKFSLSGSGEEIKELLKECK